jgi:hypothetical protein
MLCFEGIAQALAIFQGKREIPKYKLSHPEKIETLTIKPEVLSKLQDLLLMRVDCSRATLCRGSHSSRNQI